MNDPDSKIRRLFRVAALASDEVPVEMPFGFDTRVVALWRDREKSESMLLSRLVRHVTMIAAAITLIATAGAYRETTQNRETSEPSANEYAIADSAIQSEFPQ